MTFHPIVLIGPARSGTKILRASLALHDQVTAVPYDINFIWRVGNSRLPHDELGPDLASAEVRSDIRRRLERFGGSTPFLVEKTVSNCLRVPFVDAVLPDALYVQLLRDGRDVVESVRRQWLERPDVRYLYRKLRAFPPRQAVTYAARQVGDTARRLVGRSPSSTTWGPRYDGIDLDLRTRTLLEVCAEQWVRCALRADHDLALIPADRRTTIRYEEFVEDPIGEVRRVLDLAGLPRPGLDEAQLVASVSRTSVGRGLRDLEPSEVDAVLPILEPALDRFGYVRG